MNTAKKLLAVILTLMMFASVFALPASAANAPAAPASVTAAQNTSAIKLTWSKVSGATGYRIYYKLPADLSWRTAISSTTATTHTFKNLPEGQHYVFAVRSYLKSGSKVTWGGYRQITTSTQTPAPSKITAKQNTSAIQLTWSRVNSAYGYRIYYKNSALDSWKTAVSNTSSTTHTFKNLPAGKKYIFAVRSYSKSTLGAFYGKYITIEAATKPSTPATKTTTTSNSISLSWNKVNADGYRIYYKTPTTDWKVAVSTTTKTTHTFNNVNTKTNYTFAVKAYVKTQSGIIWSGYTTNTTPIGIHISINDYFIDTQGSIYATINPTGWDGKIKSNSQRIPIYVDGVEMEGGAMLQISSSTDGNGCQYICLNLDDYKIDTDRTTISFTIPEGFLENKTGTKYNYACEVVF